MLIIFRNFQRSLTFTHNTDVAPGQNMTSLDMSVILATNITYYHDIVLRKNENLKGDFI